MCSYRVRQQYGCWQSCSSLKGHVFRDGQPIIEVVSSSLYRGRLDDHENTFETVDEPDHVVQLANNAAIGVVQSKEWLSWEDEAIPPRAGMTLVFRIQSQVTFKDKTSYRHVCVTGDVYTRDQLKRLKKVASVEFNQEGCHGNPVVAYLQRHGIPEGHLTPLGNEGYTMSNNTATTFTAPNSNESYSIMATSTLSTLAHISRISPLFPEPLLMACGQVLPHVAMWRTLLLKATRIELSRKLARGYSCVCAYTFLQI